MDILDYIVVGSGCSGAMAAQTLIESGARVTMLDGGIEKKLKNSNIPDKDFAEIRKSDPNQYRYLIGENLEGVRWGGIAKGAQVTPPRRYMLDSVDDYLKLSSKNFSPLESLAYGGLGVGWGLQCWEYSKGDLIKAGLDPTRMETAYNVVARRIGVSATNDYASRYTIGSLTDYQPSPVMDDNGAAIFARYRKKRKLLARQGFHLGRTPLALITKPLKGRKAYNYSDMDYYSDSRLSAWRPWITVNELRKHSNFSYRSGYVVLKFVEQKKYTEVHCLNMKKANAPTIFKCKKLVLATGAIGSGRIVLRSLGKAKSRLPLLCNPYSYIPCLQPKLVGKKTGPKRMGLAQLSLFLDQSNVNEDASVASIYSYRSLMLFRIIKQMPLNFVDARTLLLYLLPGIIIAGIHHPDTVTKNKYMQLIPDPSSPSLDKLKISYSLSEDEIQNNRDREKKFVKAMRKLGVFGLKTINPGAGASVHYAGTLPFSTKGSPLSLSPSGKLNGTTSIYVADSSGFTYLPAQGLTFSLMANAHLVAKGVVEDA